MWLALTRTLIVTLVFLAMAEHAQAQQDQAQQNQMPQNNAALPAPSGAELNAGSQVNNNGTLYPMQVGAAPQIAPLLTPTDQNALAQNGTLGVPSGQQGNAMGQPVANGAANLANNAAAGAAQTGTIAASGATSGMQAAANGAAAGVAQTSGQLATGAAAGVGAVADTAVNAAGAVADAVTPANATNTTGFAPSGSSSTLPLNSGTMPTTNAGMNMNIDPNAVGGAGTGYDPNLPAGPNNPVPYEVQLEQRNREIQEKARGMAFEQAKKSVLPMEGYEIRDVLGRLKDTQEAIQSPVRPAPTPENVVNTISTDPAAKPKIIQLAAGNVTTINIVDITGEPWPIVDIGFGGAFDVKPPEPGGHVIRITPLKDFARGNLVVRLLKMTTPLTFSLQAGGDVVNYRFDARIPEYGPNAKMPILSGGISTMAGDKVTTAFLEGATPAGADKLAVDGVDARTSAYRYANALYLRTPLSLLSPAWQSSATSADGMNVYVLGDSPPVVLLSDNGRMVRAHIGDVQKSEDGF